MNGILEKLLPYLPTIKQFVTLSVFPVISFLVGKYYLPIFFKWRDLRHQMIRVLTEHGNVMAHYEYKRDRDYQGSGTVHYQVLRNRSKVEAVEGELRGIAGSLRALKDNTYGYGLFSKIGLFPSPKQIDKLAPEFIRWANSIYDNPAMAGETINRIAKTLEIKSH